MLQVTDGHNPMVTATIPVVIAAMDKIAGRVHDILEGSYIAGVNSSLVMPEPFAGYVKIDGKSVSVNSDGHSPSPRNSNRRHTLLNTFIRSLSNTLDSSFVARDTIAAGDYSSLDLGAHNKRRNRTYT